MLCCAITHSIQSAGDRSSFRMSREMDYVGGTLRYNIDVTLPHPISIFSCFFYYITVQSPPERPLYMEHSSFVEICNEICVCGWHAIPHSH